MTVLSIASRKISLANAYIIGYSCLCILSFEIETRSHNHPAPAVAAVETTYIPIRGLKSCHRTALAQPPQRRNDLHPD